jgi:hypothetical protein
LLYNIGSTAFFALFQDDFTGLIGFLIAGTHCGTFGFLVYCGELALKSIPYGG